MFKPRRRSAIGITALTTVAATIALAAPANAVAPDWPASHVPTDASCPITGVVPFGTSASGQNEYTITDSQLPTVTNWTVNNQSSVLVLKPGTIAGTFRILATQTCGGVGAALSGLVINGNRVSNLFPFARENTDAFSSVWATGVGLNPTLAGVYRIPTVTVSPRYASFVLKDDWSMVSNVPFAGSPTTVTGPWSSKAVYFLRATTLTNALSATKVKKGKTVKATAQLKMAGASAYLADASAKVYAQTKVGTGKWVTKAALTANASGVVSYTFVVNATTSVRFVHNKTLTGNFTNGVISAIKVVTKL